jgi:hypothetical protein
VSRFFWGALCFFDGFVLGWFFVVGFGFCFGCVLLRWLASRGVMVSLLEWQFVSCWLVGLKFNPTTTDSEEQQQCLTLRNDGDITLKQVKNRLTMVLRAVQEGDFNITRQSSDSNQVFPLASI